MEDDQAIVCLVGENIRHTPGVARRVFDALDGINVRMISQGASLLNLSFVVAEADLARGGGGAAPRVLLASSTRRCSSAMRRYMPETLAIVGYGKMGQLIEQLAPEYGFEVALKLDEFNNANCEGITRGEFPRRRCGD